MKSGKPKIKVIEIVMLLRESGTLEVTGGLNPGYNPDWDLKSVCKWLVRFVSGLSAANGSYQYS